MKQLLIIGLVTFWSGVLVLGISGLVSYENQKRFDATLSRGAQEKPGAEQAILGDTHLADAIAQGATAWTSDLVAFHKTVSDCWLTIDNNIYDVTEYISFHPGGTQTILDYCGAEATDAFRTKGGDGGDHSKSAYTLLGNYHIAALGDPLPEGQRNPLVQAGASGNATATSSSGDVRATAKGQNGATLPTDTTTQAQVKTQTQGAGLTTASVAKHNTISDCWIIVKNKVYDVTEYTPFHPGGANTIKPWCGKESTNAFNTKGGGGGSHSSSANNMLANYLVGTLGGGTPPPTTGDTIKPTVSITAPSNGATLSASVTFQASASDASGITSVALSIDGTTLKTDTSSPYNTTIDTTTYPNGSHVLTALATDTAGNTQTATISVTISNTVTPPPPANGTLDATTVATHNTTSDCWLIINNKVYNVTQYIPFHPGGTNTIKPWCGKESTNAFNTKGGGGGSHSSSANNMLANYLVGTLGGGTPPPTTGDTIKPTVSITAPSNGATLSASVTFQASASDASGITSVALSIDGTTLKTDTSSPYNTTIDTTTYPNGSHVLTALATDTAGNTQTATISVTISNTVTPPPPANGTLDATTVATHNTTSDCWLIINNKVYNVTQYIPFHPGGTNTIKPWCGKESTNAFNTKGGGGGSHSSSANNMLANYLVGTLGGGTTPPPPVTDPSQPYRDAILAQYPGASITKLSIEDSGSAEFKFTYNGRSYEGKMDASYNITKIE
ncbi:MAG: hypothetical protein KBD24_03015 [Candidatus Pacebacteria bacterium]|nr:hypothetical protein [Candidatus Paceibacterota bacterium]